MDTFVGYSTVELVDEEGDVTFPMTVMYPACTPGKSESIGQYSLDVSIEAAPKKGHFPLIILSHGSGGSHLVYRTLTHYLARNGFIIGIPEHPFNNLRDNSLAGTVENLRNRPRHIRTAIDWFFDSNRFAGFLKPDTVSIISHSMGGYTALAVAGGVPTSTPDESPDKQPQKISITPDTRVKSLVLLAPAAVWFREAGALKEVDVPMLILVGEKDEYTPYSYHAGLIINGVPDKKKIQHRMVENAGHFSFLSPFPDFLTKESFLPSQDPSGFNRESFLEELNAEVLDFLLCAEG
jgi:predicted dienelactone hydrolase